ncbi:DUF6434 domain-containing protein [uncultured Tateyamaria sp.]|uniref:DUF6434 domain-containing protein n=1 Tax=uncultured Tateyamaria sp. TaxID=455651 RepID=UPI0026358D92|nr:DUF6434 domain-containing protein [uncultured Tateyamaria sp.]
MPRGEPQDARPDMAQLATGSELRRWYWRKDELVARARTLGLKTGGGKFEVLDRIAHFLDTGERLVPQPKSAKPASRFDWHSAPLDDATVITDNYRNTQNVRRYFKSTLGDGFKFNIAFMDWMKANAGATLRDACTAYGTCQSASGKTQIRDHNQFNQYTRDFMADNPTLGMDDVRRVWALKIQQPSDTGRHRYEPGDLDL